jgi:Indole-3-glycerol phosphate synthase
MNILQKIVEAKKVRLNQRKKNLPLNALIEKIEKNKKSIYNFNFSQAIKRKSDEPIKLIAEIKKASPIKGILKKYDITEMAETYMINGADAISVITEEDFFLGNPEYIKKIKLKYPDMPVLRKDFIIDEYQVYESKALGADAILLIANILDFEQIKKLYELAQSIGLDVLLEIHNEDDLKKALSANVKIIGINNRNLKTFKISLNTTLKLKTLIPEDKITVSESGISTRADVEKLLKKGIDAILVGTSIVLSNAPAEKIRELKGF